MSRKSSNKFVLNTKLEGSTVDKVKQVEDLELLNSEGEVIKTLRPSGLALINGHDYDVVSHGEFIAKGEKIVVDKIEGNKIYCRRKN